MKSTAFKETFTHFLSYFKGKPIEMCTKYLFMSFYTCRVPRYLTNINFNLYKTKMKTQPIEKR